MDLSDGYLPWLVRETPTTWWVDSGDPDEIRLGLSLGATGVTTNPLLVADAVRSRPEEWGTALRGSSRTASADRALHLLQAVARNAAALCEPVHRRTAGKLGYACAQVDPAKAFDRSAMLEMARRFRLWAPNIAVKLPATAAGLDVMEECVAEGIPVTATVSFTLPQMIAAAERCERGLDRAAAAGRGGGRCFLVMMIGRLDDYLREVIRDRRADAAVSESDVRQAGLAVAKRAWGLFRERGYRAELIVAALRGPHHAAGLAGGDLVLSIHPKVRTMLSAPDVPRDPRGIEAPVARDVVGRLAAIPDFVRAYEPDGMVPEEFIGYGLTQRTLTSFAEKGWAALAGL